MSKRQSNTSMDRLIAFAVQLTPDRPEAVGDLIVAAMGMLLDDLPRDQAIKTFQEYAAAVAEAAAKKGSQ